MSSRDCPAKDLEIISSLTPFPVEELTGYKFKNGGMLGGAQPLESAVPAPWEKENLTKPE